MIPEEFNDVLCDAQQASMPAENYTEDTQVISIGMLYEILREYEEKGE